MDSYYFPVKILSSFWDGLNIYNLFAMVVSGLGILYTHKSYIKASHQFYNETAYKYQLSLIDVLSELQNNNEEFYSNYLQGISHNPSYNEYHGIYQTFDPAKLSVRSDELYAKLQSHFNIYKKIFSEDVCKSIEDVIQYRWSAFDKEQKKYIPMFGEDSCDDPELGYETQGTLLKKAINNVMHYRI